MISSISKKFLDLFGCSWYAVIMFVWYHADVMKIEVPINVGSTSSVDELVSAYQFASVWPQCLLSTHLSETEPDHILRHKP